MGFPPASLWGGVRPAPAAAPAAGGGRLPWVAGFALGVSRGFFLGGGFSCAGGVPWLVGGSAVCTLVAAAGGVGVVVWGLPLARSPFCSVVLVGGGRGRVCVAGCRVGLRGSLVGLGRVPAGRAAVCWRGGSGLGCVRAGGRAALAAAGRSRRAARSGRVGAGGLGWPGVLAPPWRAAQRCSRRCRSGWRGCRGAAGAGFRAVARAVWPCAARRLPSRRCCAVALGCSVCHPSALAGAACSCCCPSPASRPARCRCALGRVPPLSPRRRPCPAFRCRFRRVAVLLILHCHPCPLFLPARGGFFSWICCT